MKNLYILILILSLPFLINSQTATSVSNGAWTNPATWNCMCVPLMGHSVTINHTVTLNTSMSFTAGGITINTSGALMQDASGNRDLWFNGGSFYNYGKANFRYLLITGGMNSNNGSFTVSAMTNSVNFNNVGTITMDSMYMAGNFVNASNGKIIGDSLTIGPIATLSNSGRINVTWSTNRGIFNNNNYHGGYAFTNEGQYYNFQHNDSTVMTGSLWNKNYFNNNGYVRLTKNFHNYTPNKVARFINSFDVKVLDSWYNTDTIYGVNTGTFTVSDTSANSGGMLGTFKFCDLTPPPSTPFIDFNSGSISTGITWCTTSNVQELNPTANVTYFPNPSNGRLTIEGEKEDKLFLYNDIGKMIKEIELNHINNFKAEIIGLDNGVYFLTGKRFREKIIVIK